MPTSRHINCISWSLNAFHNLEIFFTFCFYYFWKYIYEIVDGFWTRFYDSLLNQPFAFNDTFWNMRRKQHPSFVPCQRCIPSRSKQRINMNIGTRSFWTYQKPSVRRSFFLTYNLKIIISKPFMNLIVLNNIFCFSVFYGTFKKIQWTIIFII